MPVIILRAVMMIPVIITVFDTPGKKKYHYQGHHKGTEHILFHLQDFMTISIKKSCQSLLIYNI
jgi:hypothetical protein